MIQFYPQVTYYWFENHVEAHTSANLVKYQFIKDANDVDFTKYHVGIFENEYTFMV